MDKMTSKRTRVQLALLVILPIALSGCAASLGLWAWDEYFKNDDVAVYRVLVDGYDVGSTPSPAGILNLAGIAGGDYLVSVAKHPTKRSGLHELLNIVPGLSVSLRRFNPFEGGVITGTVRRDSAAGPLVANVRVVAIKDAATLLAGGSGPIDIPQSVGTSIEYMMAYTDDKGSYRLGPATSGKWLVTAAIAGHAADVKHVDVLVGGDRNAALVLTADAGASVGHVRGTVTAAGGAPLAEPLLTATLGAPFVPTIEASTRTQVGAAAGVTMPAGAWFRWHTLTDIGPSQGQYLLDLPPGAHNIGAYKFRYRAKDADITVTTGVLATLDFSLARAS